MRSLFSGFLVMALMFVSMSCSVAQQENPWVGKKAPDFTLERLSGKSASLSDVIRDKKAILFFFATWCPHCRSQLKEISARKAELEKAGIAVALVDIGEPKSQVAKFMKSYGGDNDVFLDVDSFVAQTYEVAGVPMLLFIGIDGKVRLVEYGLPDNYQEVLE